LTPVAVISGVSKGLGAAVARDLLGSGHAVAGFSRSSTSAVEELRAGAPDRFHWRAIDGTDFDATTRFVGEAVERFGRVDVLLNNAAAMILGTLPLTTPAHVHQMVALNLEGAIHLSRVCSRHMIHQRSGCILNISTVNALRGYRGVAVYAATKAGLDAMTRCLARELGSRGIRVNSIAPGYFESDLSADVSARAREKIKEATPIGRLGTVEDMLGAIRFLLSPGASFITGQVMVVDGGLTC
jgi:3-oxoacyl-[acyl-carrier protein] reductase